MSCPRQSRDPQRKAEARKPKPEARITLVIYVRITTVDRVNS